MSGQSLMDGLKAQFGELITGANTENVDPWIEVAPEGILQVAGYLRDTPDLQFDFLNCISGVDYLHTDPKQAAKADFEPHMEVVYHLWSTVHRHSLVLKVLLPRWQDGVEGSPPEVPSVTSLWSTANWHEREVYDLSGVKFTGHPNFRRILCPEDWVGHPLRKDYEMPLDYHGIRCR